MIGVIGPADSVRLALSLARADGLGDDVMGRSYEVVDEAPALARELDAVCQVLLFTGRFPYALGRREGGLRAALQYVPHSGADLYGTIVRLLRERDCELPRVSLDTIEPEVVQEAYEDLGLEPPDHVMRLEVDVDDEETGVRSAADIVAFHRERYRAGDVDMGLTCVGSVYQELRSEGIPAWRITHTKSVMREALRQAHLAERLAITEATQPAAVLITLARPRSTLSDDGGPYESQRQQLRARVAVLDIAERLQGRLADIDDETSIIYASRGTIENAVSRLMAGHEGPLSLERLPGGIRMGVGLGSTVAAAESNARLSLTMGQRDGALHVGFPDGEVLRVGADRPPTTYRLREIDPSALRVAQELGIGPLALTRLIRALQQVDASAVTAVELARAYGIEVRSARRLITSLKRARIATRLGSQGGPRAGRPQTVYSVDLDRLLGTGRSWAMTEQQRGRPVAFGHVGLQVRDLKRSRTYYRDIIGLVEVEHTLREEPYLARVTGYPGVRLDTCLLVEPSSGVMLELLEYLGVSGSPIDPATANPGTAHVCLQVDDVDAVHRRAIEAGYASVDDPVTPTAGRWIGGRSVYLIDPDGIRVELVQSGSRMA